MPKSTTKNSLKIGMPAPQFTLSDENGKSHSLGDYLGQKVILYFYPKDMTSGCTLEAQGFRDLEKEFSKLNVKIFGISVDNEKSHKKFCDKESLNFSLLSDIEKKVVNDYGVWVEKKMYGKAYMGIQRDTFVIGEDGKVLAHFEKVDPMEHPKEVLLFVKSEGKK